MVSKEERQEIEKEYEELKKKYDLPSLKEIEDEISFKLSYQPALTSIILVLNDRFAAALGHFESILHPSRIAEAVESKFHDEKEKQDMLKMYKILMALVHEIGASLYETEKDRAKIIKKAYQFFKEEFKPFVNKFLIKQSEQWREEAKRAPEKTQQGTYFG